MTTEAREANTAGSEVILWQDYTLGCSPAPYWGDRLDDDLQSLETAIFMVIFNSEIQTRVHIWYMSQTVGNIIVNQRLPKRANINTLMAHAGLNKRINIFNLCKYWWLYWRKSFQVNIKTCHYFILYTLMMLSTIFQNGFSFLMVIT